MESNALCCCEYYDAYGERKHMLECCCNCVALDLCFERFVTCKPIPRSLLLKIMLSVGDRTRIPWIGGAKQCSFNVVLPILLVPLFFIVAAQGVWMSVIVFSFLPILLLFIHFFCMKINSPSSFFLIWNITSFVTIAIIFESIGVTLLEIRTEENIAFLFFLIVALYCIHQVVDKEKSKVVNSCNEDLKMCLLCTECNLKVPPRTYHCNICQTCIPMRNQHCAWFNCCIGENNHHWFMAFLVTSMAYFLLCSNLILTTACHPFPFLGPILLPDDCSEVYFDILYAVCFVTAIYCLEAAVFIVAILIFECWLISIGMTGHEFRNKSRRAFLCGLCSPRPFSRGILNNWICYFKKAEKKRLAVVIEE